MRRLPFVLTLSIGCAHGSAGNGETVLLRDDTRGIQVVGEGEVEATPDTAIFQVGVEVRRPTVAEVREVAANTMQQVLAAVRQAGVDERHVRTQNLSVAPDYEYSEQGRRLLGYVATNQVEVRTTDLAGLGALMDGAVRAGGDDARLDGLRFELDEADQVRAQAREEAMQKARAQATQLATLLEVELGEPLSVEEVVSGGGPEPIMMRAEMARGDDAAQTPVQPGTTRVIVQLRVRWAIRAR